MKIVKKAVGENPVVMDVENKYDELRKLVGGGYIEIIRLGGGIVLVIDEEGKLNGSKPNFDLGNDVVMGDCFFVAEGMVDGEIDFKDLTQTQISIILDGPIDLYSEPKNEPDLSFEFISWD